MQRGADRDLSPDDSSLPAAVPAAVPAPPAGASGEMEEEEEFNTTNMDRRERMIFKKYRRRTVQKQMYNNRDPDFHVLASGQDFASRNK